MEFAKARQHESGQSGRLRLVGQLRENLGNGTDVDPSGLRNISGKFFLRIRKHSGELSIAKAPNTKAQLPAFNGEGITFNISDTEGKRSTARWTGGSTAATC
jgi:hypothetical protein